MSRASHVAAFALGLGLAGALAGAAPRVPGDRYAALDTFAQALANVSANYVTPVDERDLLYNGIRGMLRGLDPHSAFYSPKRYRELRQDTEGEFGSIGLVLGPGIVDDQAPDRPPWPFIDAVAPGSPAERAGLQVDDRLVSVAGQPTAHKDRETKNATAWEQTLRGPSGTRVDLVIFRAGWPAPRPFSLVREIVKVPSVESIGLADGIGYLAIRRFQEATTADVEVSVRQLKKAQQLRALILDLRGNPGGLLDQAIATADMFLEQGLIVTIAGRRGAVEEAFAKPAGTWSGFPVICLVDGQTASAAEILAAALQDRRRAFVVGLPTYGKGSVQTFYDLVDGSGMKLTTARYITPSGKSLEGAGITPDMVVDDFAAEDIVAGSAVPGHPSEKAAGGTPGAANGNDARIRERLVGDPQFSAAYNEARRRLGLK